MYEPLLRAIQALGWSGCGVLVLILGVLVFGTARYLVPLWRTSKAFSKATARVRANRGQRVLFPKHPSHLNELWKQYLTDREGTTVEVEGAEISTVDPEDIFTEHAVLRGYNRNMALAFAGVFTGLGILGTFLGLVQGLSEIQGTNPTAMMDNILGLLGGMSTAFYTSIAGIGVSLFWLLIDRALYHQIQREIVGFFGAVRMAYPVESADRLLHRLLAVEQEESAAIHRMNDVLLQHGETLSADSTVQHTNKLLTEQKSILQTLGTDLAVAFQDALSQTVTGELVPALQAVVQSVEGISTQLGERQVDTMKELVSSFQEQLSSQLEGQFEGLATALERNAEWQTLVHSEIKDLVEHVREATTRQIEVINRSTEISTLFQDGVAKLSLAHEQLGQSADRVEGSTSRITTELEEFTNRVSTHLEQLSATLAHDLERAAGIVSDTATALTGSIERIDLQARALEDRIEELDAQQETYRQANEDIRTHLAGQIDALDEQVGTLTRFWGDFRSDLASVGDQLQASVAQFSVFTADKLQEIFARFDAEMATVVQHLSGTLAEIRDVNEDLPANVERLRSTLSDAVSSISEAGGAMQKLTGSIDRVETLSTSIRGLHPLNDTIRTAAAQIGEAGTSAIKLDESLKIVDRRLLTAFSIANGSPVNEVDSSAGEAGDARRASKSAPDVAGLTTVTPPAQS